MEDFLQSFTDTTVAVLRTDGIEGYLPTLVIPSQATVTVIQGIGPGASHTRALIETINERGLNDEELLFGVKSGSNTVVTGHYVPGARSQFIEITLVGGEFKQRPLHDCGWWTVTSSKRPH